MPRLTIQRNGHVHEVLFNGTPLLSHVLIEAGMALPQPCGGRGHCGKCGVDITGHISPPNQQEERAGRRLSCQITLQGDCHVVLPEQRMAAQIQTEGTGHTKLLSPMPGKVGAAVDLGTTTLALRLYSLENGNLLASAAGTNPQVEVAADVMSRIDAAMQGRLAWLEQSVLIALEALLLEAGEKAGIHPDEITSLVLTGNTTMLYLASGKTPKSLAQLPFQADTLFGNWCELL